MCNKQETTKHKTHTHKEKPTASQICSKLRKESSDYTVIFNFFLIKVFCIISPNFINALILLHMDTFFMSVPLWVCKMVILKGLILQPFVINTTCVNNTKLLYFVCASIFHSCTVSNFESEEPETVLQIFTSLKPFIFYIEIPIFQDSYNSFDFVRKGGMHNGLHLFTFGGRGGV